MASWIIIFKGLISVTVNICFVPFFSSSMGANILVPAVSFRILCALYLRMVGPYVSGRKSRKNKDTPENAKATQYAHRQLTGEMKPDITGANCGPQVVAYQVLASIPDQRSDTLTAMKIAKARPRVTGLA